MMNEETDRWLREFLWANHGHQGQYGDDGELQCMKCGHWDYRREPIDVLIAQARGHSQLRDLRVLAEATR